MENANDNMKKQYKKLQLSLEELQNIMRNLEINERHPLNNSDVQKSNNRELNKNRCARRKVREIKTAHHAPWLSKECAETVLRRRLALKNIHQCFAWDEEL